MMKLLFVLDKYGLFGTPNSGASNRNTLFVKALTKLGHVDVCSFSDEAIVSDIEAVDIVYSNTKCVFSEKGNKYVRGLLSLIWMTLSPLNPNAYYRPCRERECIIDELVRKNDYDIIACRYISTAIRCGLLKYYSKLVLDIDDNPANSIKTIAASLNSLPIKVKSLYTSNHIARMVEKVLNNVFCSFYSNVLEPPSKKSVFLHNTTTCVADVPGISCLTPNRLLLMGALNYPPNKYGCYHFLNKIFPLIKQRVPDVELQIIGKGDNEMLEGLNKLEGISAPGFVEDIVAAYNNARVVVIPMYQGSGTCVKFVEALFMNRPIVSTPVGARGFDTIARDNEHYLLAKSDAEFADKTTELLLSVSKSNELAKQGYELAQKWFSKDRFISIVEETIKIKFLNKTNQ